MWTRRQSREYALNMLYALDICRMPSEDIFNAFKESMPEEKSYRNFIETLFNGVGKNKEMLDSLIAECALNWDIKRMSAVDRNILRLAAFEIIFTPDIPANVVLDEAIEISKKYSTQDSSKFVNGVLDKLKNIRNGEKN
jgi:N utilization substance protein B